MRSITRRLSYANVASTTALALALAGGGTAVAAGLVGTAQIKNGAVTAPKIANGAVISPKIANGAVGTAKIANSSISGGKVAPNGLTGTQINEGTLGKVPAAGLADRAGNVLTAVVRSDGTLDPTGRNFGATGVVKQGAGTYEVDFNRDVTSCSFVLSDALLEFGTAPAVVAGGTKRASNPNGVWVRTYNLDGTATDHGFVATVVC
jgi:hypothetical protein